MKYINNFKLIIPIFLILLSSCVSQKKLIYLQNKDESTIKNEFVNERNEEYKVQVGDNLYIKIRSINEDVSQLFNINGSAGGLSGNVNSTNIYLDSYVVDNDGNVFFPFIGKVQVKNLVVEDIQNKIKSALSEYLKETNVIVKLVNFNITLLGEVRDPGQYKVYQKKINLLEAIAMAGDLSDFANRNEIQIIRQTKQGSKILKLDLTDQNILESELFYLMPNDMIYVTPLKGKQFAFANFPYGLVFSTLSTVLLLINFFQ